MAAQADKVFKQVDDYVQKMQRLLAEPGAGSNPASLREVLRIDKLMSGVQERSDVMPSPHARNYGAELLEMFVEPSANFFSPQGVDELIEWLKTRPNEMAWFDEHFGKGGSWYGGPMAPLLREKTPASEWRKVLADAGKGGLSQEAQAAFLPFLLMQQQLRRKLRPEDWHVVAQSLKDEAAKEAALRDKCSKKPASGSAPIAVYNPEVPAAARKRAGSAPQSERDDALCQCTLAMRNVGCLVPKAGVRPFELPPKVWRDFDVEGDTLAACGDLHFSGNSQRNFVGFYHVPDTVDFKSRGGHGGLKGNTEAFTGCTDMVYNVQERGGRGSWYSSVLADASNKVVWAADSGGFVRGFQGKTECAALALPQAMLEATEAYTSYRFALARLGNTLVCAGGDSKLRLWKIDKAREEFSSRAGLAEEAVRLSVHTGATAEALKKRVAQMTCKEIKEMIRSLRKSKTESSAKKEKGARRKDDGVKGKEGEHELEDGEGEEEDEEEEEEDEDEDEDEDEEDDSDLDAILDDRYRKESTQFCHGIPPDFEVSMFKGARVSDVKSLTGSQILVSFGDPEDDGDGSSGLRRSLHIFDTEARKTVGILAGHWQLPNMERQLCASTHLAMTSEDCGVCKVWDLRTCRAMLHLPSVLSNSLDARHPVFSEETVSILGVPFSSGSGGAMAFTTGSDACLRAWDLRAVRTKALWTMSTGDLVGWGLAWHEGSQSLFVRTCRPHLEDTGGARTHRSACFFPEPYSRDSPDLLRYAFCKQDQAAFQEWARNEAVAEQERMKTRFDSAFKRARVGA